MLALVLSGGANLGAMQAGALEILFEAGFHPEMIVGTSAGAINAIHIAYNPTPEGAQQLAELWQTATPSDVGSLNIRTVLGCLATRRGGLFPSEPLARFLRRHFPPGIETFSQLAALGGIRVFATAVCIETGGLRVFGDRGNDRLIDGVMASSAFIPHLPPWEVDGEHYLDGGIITRLPLRAAIERGATQLIALNIGHEERQPPRQNLLSLCAYALELFLDHQMTSEIAWTRATGIPLRLINLPAPIDIPSWDYSQAGRLSRLGREIAQRELERESLKIYPTWQRRFYRFLADRRMRWLP